MEEGNNKRELYNKSKSPKKKIVKPGEERKEMEALQKEISETEERLRKLYINNNASGKEKEKEKILHPPKKITPTFLSYAGSEISYGINQNREKYEVDVIGNIVKRNKVFDQSYHTIDGINRFGAGLKNLDNETTLNPIPKKYSEKYK